MKRLGGISVRGRVKPRKVMLPCSGRRPAEQGNIDADVFTQLVSSIRRYVDRCTVKPTSLPPGLPPPARLPPPRRPAESDEEAGTSGHEAAAREAGTREAGRREAAL